MVLEGVEGIARHKGGRRRKRRKGGYGFVRVCNFFSSISRVASHPHLTILPFIIFFYFYVGISFLSHPSVAPHTHVSIM